jgi:AbrB family looped-hinge helix DNA binding protein
MCMKIIVPTTKIIVSSRGQFVIPKEARDACGIHGGSEILVKTREDGVIELRPLKRNIAELFKGLSPTKGSAVKIEEAITEVVDENDARTKTVTRKRS